MKPLSDADCYRVWHYLNYVMAMYEEDGVLVRPDIQKSKEDLGKIIGQLEHLGWHEK